MIKRKSIVVSGLFWYAVAITYRILMWQFGTEYSQLINYSYFIGHLVFLAILILVSGLMYFTINVQIPLDWSEEPLSPQDKNKIKIIGQTFPHRTLLGVCYVAAPMLMYLYFTDGWAVLTIFKYYMYWFPVVYALAESLIRKKEKAINSPLAKSEQ